jgi:hypothetical protein
MRWWDTLTGRTVPAPANLDALFALPGAVLTVQASMGATATGNGAVCFKTATGAAATAAATDALQLLRFGDDTQVEHTTDSYGYSWLVCRTQPGDTAGLITGLHAVNSTLQDNGFGPFLLRTLIEFRCADEATFDLVYLYPFAARSETQRDTTLELQIRRVLEGEIPVEEDLARWFPVWHAPL